MPFIWTDINSPFIVHSRISSNCIGHVNHFGEASAEKKDAGEYERYSRKMWQWEGWVGRLWWVPFRTNQLHNTENNENYTRRPHITEALRQCRLDNKGKASVPQSYSSPTSVEKFAQRLLKLTRRRRPEIVAQRWLSLTLRLQQASDRGLSIQSLFLHVEDISDWREKVWYIRQASESFLSFLSDSKIVKKVANQMMRTKSRWKSENQKRQRRAGREHVSAFLLLTSAQWVLIWRILNGQDSKKLKLKDVK